MRILRNLLYYFILTAISACSATGVRDSGHIEDETRAAKSCGREEALRLAPSENLDSLEMEKILIDVKVRESALRREGEDALADYYIESFLVTLDSVNHTLYSKIAAGQ